jgi:hypothetical protein
MQFWKSSMRYPFFASSRVLFSAALFTAFAAFSTPSAAQLATDDTEMQGSGESRIEVMLGRDRIRAGGETGRVYSLPVTYYYGLMDELNIFVGSEYARIRFPGEHTRGFGNTSMGVKWQFFENKASGTRLSVRPELAIPVSSHREDEGLGTGKTSGNVNLILGQEVPFGAVYFNAIWGRDRYRHSDDNATNKHFSVAPVWEISEKWQLVFDTGIDYSRSGGHTVRSKFAAIGVDYAPNDDFDVELGFMRATDNDSPKAKTNSIISIWSWRF